MKQIQHLIFKLGEESFPTVLSAEEEVNSPFADIISHANQRLDNISELLDKVRRIEPDTKWLDETPNNIIALLGDRGSGKTSCMRTLVSNCRVKHSNWLIADEIDPSFFDDKHNVLDIFIGSLYGLFKQETEYWQNKDREVQDSLREIQALFIQVKASLSYISKLPNDAKINDDEYEIDSLNYLNNGGNLRINLKELISKILKYKKKDFLLLCIDDLDLNIKQSYVMMEQIRKYLIIPNVIIIIAAKYNQLFDSVCLDLADIYKNIDYRVSHKDIAIMAERYLNKMLPLDQRLEMPQVDSYMDAMLHIIDEKGESKYTKDESVKLRVPALIFEKTRFLFYNSSDMPSPVIPRNLRDLRMLVSMLTKMKPFSEDGTHNKRIFKDYFFKEWLGIIEPEYKTFVQSIIAEENLAKINRFVISNLYDFFLSKIEPITQLKAEVEEIRRQGKSDSYSLERELLYNILNPTNSFWNVSLGDVVVIINAVKKTNDSDKVLSLLFFIESLYSIKLYESYDKLTAMTGENGIVIPEDATSEPELKSSVQGDMPEYFRLIGGSFFSLTGDYFTPLPQSPYPIHHNAREIRLINGRLLTNEIRTIEQEYDRLKKSNLSLSPDLAARLRLCEFFMLTVTYREDLKTSNSNQRLLNEPLYFKKFGNSVKNLIFDISAPFFNAIYPEYAYNRFSSKIFNIAKESKDSLLNRMAAKAHARVQDNPTWELMSKTAIRNMEVLQDLTSWLHDNRNENKPNTNGVLGVLSSFYKQFDFPVEEFEESYNNNRGLRIRKGIYCVKTYDKTRNEDKLPYYYIEFSIYSLLGEVISDIISPQLHNGQDFSDKLRNIFNGIMAADNIFILKDAYTYEEISETLTLFCGKTTFELIVGSNHAESYSLDELAQILAELRVKYQFDFNGKLPEPLLTSYNIQTNTIYQEEKSEFSQKIDSLKESLKEMSDELEQSADSIKQLQSAITQYPKNLRKVDEDSIKFRSDINEQNWNLEFLNNRLADNNLEKTEITRLRKEVEKMTKALNTAKASYNAVNERRWLIESQMNEANESLKKLKADKKTLEKNIRKLQQEISRQEKNLQQLDQNMKNPRTIGYGNY